MRIVPRTSKMAVKANALPPSPSQVKPSPAMNTLARSGPITHQNSSDIAKQTAVAASSPSHTDPVA